MAKLREVVLASANAGKQRELASLLAPLGTRTDTESGPHNFFGDKGLNQRTVLAEIEEIRPGYSSATTAIGPGDGDQPVLSGDQRKRPQRPETGAASVTGP